ncbi:MAG TPA: class II aldolase/adducin family protein [Bryobacteraceae bacterium]|jgi:L-fuculose-phosphate aldolase
MHARVPQTEQELRQEMVRVGRFMSEKGWIAACDGNLSARMGDDRLLVTPAGACKGMLAEDDPIVCGLDGKKIEGKGRPSSELHMHLTIYQMRHDVRAVVHAHPPVATGFAAAGRELNLGLLPEVIVGLGSVPLAAYGTPGTPALGESLLPHVEEHDAVLLANHGAVAWGEELFQAYSRMEKVEHFARITLVAELLGGARPLPRAEIETLFAARARYGIKSRTRFQPGNPLAAEDLPDPTEKIQMTREQLLALLDEAMKVRGVY